MSSSFSPVRAEHDQPRRRRRERHVALLPRQHPAVAGLRRAQAHALRPEAALRLQPGGRHDRLAARDLRQPLLLLGVAARRDQHARAHHRRLEGRRRRERAAQLLEHDHGLEQRLRRAAVLLGHQHAEQAQLRQLLPERVGHALRVVLHRAHHRDRAVLGAQLAHRVAQDLLLFAEVEVHAISPTAATRRRAASRGCRLPRSAARCAPCTRSSSSRRP